MSPHKPSVGCQCAHDEQVHRRIYGRYVSCRKCWCVYLDPIMVDNARNVDYANGMRDNPTKVKCPSCYSKPGEPCSDLRNVGGMSGSSYIKAPHKARRRAAREKQPT